MKKRRKKQAVAKKRNKISPKRNNKTLVAALVVAALTFVVSLFFIPKPFVLEYVKFEKGVFYFLSFAFSVLSFWLVANQHKIVAKNIAKYTFLVLLAFGFFVSFVFQFNDPQAIFSQQLLALQVYLIVPVAILGLLSIFMYRSKAQQVIDSLFTDKNEERHRSFNESYVQPVQRFFSRKEILTSSVLFLLIGLSAVTLFYKLDYSDLYSDEAQVTQGAAGYFHSGEYRHYDFGTKKLSAGEYSRAWPHLWVVAQSYRFFGISNWTSRLPSAIFALLLIVLMYFVGQFFIRDKLAVLLVAFAFVFYFEMLFLQRWTRMYAMLAPAYLLLFYWVYRFFTETSSFAFLNSEKLKFVRNYLNFNYLLIPVVALFLYLNIQLHINSAFLLPLLLLFSIVIISFTKNKKYMLAAIIGSALLIWQILFPYRVGFKWFTFFEVDNADAYSYILFAYPFFDKTNIALLLTGFGLLFFVRNEEFRKKYIFLALSSVTAYVLFGYVIEYAASFRYLSYLAPLAVLLIIGLYVLIFRVLYNKIIQILLSVLIVASVLSQFYQNYPKLYIQNPHSFAHPSVAWQSIVKNAKKGEIVLRHWGPSFYFSGIDTTVQFLSLGGDKGKPFKQIFDSLQNHKSGWLTWHTQNSHRIDSILKIYCNLYFEKHNGQNIDSSYVEVFHYTKEMLVDTNRVKADNNFPLGNIKAENTRSVAFWVSVSSDVNPFFLVNTVGNEISRTFLDKSNNLVWRFNTATQDSMFVNIPNDGKLHHVVYYQSGGKKGDELGIWLDGKFIASQKLKTSVSGLAKFRYNPQYLGMADDIRIYNFLLNKKQISTIMQNYGRKRTESLIADNQEFTTIYLWQRK